MIQMIVCNWMNPTNELSIEMETDAMCRYPRVTWNPEVFGFVFGTVPADGWTSSE